VVYDLVKLVVKLQRHTIEVVVVRENDVRSRFVVGHDRIDLLKLDVEGVECDILKDLFDHKVYTTIICVEFDLLRYDPGNEKVRHILTEIERLGYKLFYRSGLDFTFMRC
jgi:FkbM family methyltransferase